MKQSRKTLYCQLCGKTTQFAFNRPKSLHKTQRLVHPNIQKWHGLLICNRCRRIVASKLEKAGVVA